jgi:hypothetical protein
VQLVVTSRRPIVEIEGRTATLQMMRIVISWGWPRTGWGTRSASGVGAQVWFAAAWLLPGLGFVVGSWGFCKHISWWHPVTIAFAVLSLALEGLAGVSLQPGPYASAAVFNVLVLLVLLVPRTRQLVAEM